MPPIFGIGEAISASSDAIGTGIGMMWSSEEARKQREWQQHMSNTAVRRHARDLRKAGFNRIIAAGGSPGASTPSGAKGQWPGTPQLAAGMSKMGTLRLEKGNLKATNENLKKTAGLITAQTAAQDAAAAAHSAQALSHIANARGADAAAVQIEMRNKFLQENPHIIATQETGKGIGQEGAAAMGLWEASKEALGKFGNRIVEGAKKLLQRESYND